MLNYDFMRVAFIVGILLAITIPLIGVTVVLKRLSMIGDALSHASMAGILGGLVIGINPVLGAVIISLMAALSIEFIRKKFKRYAELSISIVTSAGLGIAGILLSFVNNATNFNSFLFGSIVSITDFEFYLVIGSSIAVVALSMVLYRSLFYMAFDEEAAHLSGIKTTLINVLFTIMTAVTVSLASRTVGALIVSSLMVIPVATAMMISRSYKQTVIYSVLFALLFMISGLTCSFYLGLRPGGSIVTIGIICLILVIILKTIFRIVRKHKQPIRGADSYKPL